MSDAADMALGWETVKSFGGKIVQALLGFVGTIVFARVLGPVSFGGFYFLLSMVFLADRPVFGIGQAVRKRYSEEGADRPEIMGGVLLVLVAFFGFATLVVLPLNDLLERRTHVRLAALVFLSILVTRGLFMALQQMVVATGQLSKQTWNDTFRSVLTLPFQLALVLGGLGSAGMGYGLAGASLIAAGVAAYIVGERPALPSRETVRSLWSYARYSTPSAVIGKAYDRLDVLLLGVLVTTGAVGYYEVAFKLTVPGTFLTSIVMSGLMPKVSSLVSKGKDIAVDVTNVASYVSILSIPVFFGTLALSRPLVVTLYGSAYAPASAFLVGLALFQVVSSQSAVFVQTLMGLDHPEIKLRINVVALALNIVVGVGLIITVGPIGVVVATVLAESLRYVASAYIVVQNVDGVSLLPRPLFEQIVAGVLMYAFVIVLEGTVNASLVERTASGTPIHGFVTYLASSTGGQNLFAVIALLVVVAGGAACYGLVLLALSERLRFTIQSVVADARSK